MHSQTENVICLFELWST